MADDNALALPLKEFDAEMASTRKLLSRVPSGKAQWKPHEKSFALGHLAQLVAWIPGWITETLLADSIDIGGGTGYSFEKTETLVELFDTNVSEARAALQQVTGARLNESWSLKHGANVIMTNPRGEQVRQHLNHFIHHRGQLTVYVRLVDQPLPMIYGPTADERWPMPS